MLDSKQTIISDPVIAKQVFAEQRSTFAYPSNDLVAGQLIEKFFSAPEFLKRLRIHQLAVCKSTTKQR